MGCAPSSEATPESQNSKNVEAFLKESKLDAALDFKVLLLGAGESGKSTVVKQLKTLYKVQMDDHELMSYAINIHKNTLQCMQILLEASDSLQIPLLSEESKTRAENVKSFVFESDHKRMPVSIGEDISALWRDEEIQKIWERRSEYWFLDATPYYFEHIQRFIEDDYVPTEEDCIMTRVRTTGIAVTEFDDGPIHYRVVDVGGQRNERKKWIHCFDDVKALLFVVNLAGYDQVMFEDPTKNRMEESLELFGQICNNPVFTNTPIFLFLNKKDLFEAMMQNPKTPLTKCFENYKPPESPETELNAPLVFIQDQFKTKLSDTKRTIHTEYIAARFKKDIKNSWDEVKKVLMEDNRRVVERVAKDKQTLRKKK